MTRRDALTIAAAAVTRSAFPWPGHFGVPAKFKEHVHDLPHLPSQEANGGPWFQHYPVEISSVSGWRRYDGGRFIVGLGRRTEEFHPLEWSPESKLDPENPWNKVPVDKKRVAVAARMRDKIKAWSEKEVSNG